MISSAVGGRPTAQRPQLAHQHQSLSSTSFFCGWPSLGATFYQPARALERGVDESGKEVGGEKWNRVTVVPPAYLTEFGRARNTVEASDVLWAFIRYTQTLLGL